MNQDEAWDGLHPLLKAYAHSVDLAVGPAVFSVIYTKNWTIYQGIKFLNQVARKQYTLFYSRRGFEDPQYHVDKIAPEVDPVVWVEENSQ